MVETDDGGRQQMINDYAEIVAVVKHARRSGIAVSPQQQQLCDDSRSMLRNLIPDSQKRDAVVFVRIVKLYIKDKQFPTLHPPSSQK